jgi:hypothetical protein
LKYNRNTFGVVARAVANDEELATEDKLIIDTETLEKQCEIKIYSYKDVISQNSYKETCSR